MTGDGLRGADDPAVPGWDVLVGEIADRYRLHVESASRGGVPRTAPAALLTWAAARPSKRLQDRRPGLQCAAAVRSGPRHRGRTTIREVRTVQDIRSDSGAEDPRWVKSSLSFANGDCVQVACLADGRVGIRDSKDPAGPVLRFTRSEWAAFLGGVQSGEFIAVLSG